MENTNEKKTVETTNTNKEVNKSEQKRHSNYVTAYDLMRPFLSLFDDDSFDEVTSESGLMRTDIIEKDNEYVFDVEVPGVDKSNVKVGLDNGYLIISYKITEEKVEGVKKIHKERKTGYYKREFFVGYNVEKEDIKAKMDNGILSVIVPKNAKKEDNDKFITIE